MTREAAEKLKTAASEEKVGESSNADYLVQESTSQQRANDHKLQETSSCKSKEMVIAPHPLESHGSSTTNSKEGKSTADIRSDEKVGQASVDPVVRSTAAFVKKQKKPTEKLNTEPDTLIKKFSTQQNRKECSSKDCFEDCEAEKEAKDTKAAAEVNFEDLTHHEQDKIETSQNNQSVAATSPPKQQIDTLQEKPNTETKVDPPHKMPSTATTPHLQQKIDSPHKNPSPPNESQKKQSTVPILHPQRNVDTPQKEPNAVPTPQEENTAEKKPNAVPTPHPQQEVDTPQKEPNTASTSLLQPEVEDTPQRKLSTVSTHSPQQKIDSSQKNPSIAPTSPQREVDTLQKIETSHRHLLLDWRLTLQRKR